MLKELDSLIEALQNTLPANPVAERNEKLAGRLERELAEYFRALDDALPWDAIEQLYYRHVT